MIYWRLSFHDGPWHGQELEVDTDPVVVEVRIAAADRTVSKPYASELWRYEPGVKEGDLVHMMGLKI